MFTPPNVSQITKAYQGNPAPLNAKVEQDKKQNRVILRFKVNEYLDN